MTANSVANFFALELDCNPFAGEHGLPESQRLALNVDGYRSLDAPRLWPSNNHRVYFSQTRTDPATFWNSLIEHPDGGRPSEVKESSDARLLSIAMVRARLFSIAEPAPVAALLSCKMLPAEATAGTPAARYFGGEDVHLSDLVNRFESIGHDCEFGVFSAFCAKLSPLAGCCGSRRYRPSISDSWSLTPGFMTSTIRRLITAVDTPPAGDFHIHHGKYRFRYHTHSYPKEHHHAGRPWYPGMRSC